MGLESCDNVTANARCYTILDKQRKLPLDSCDRNLINTRGTDTVGDYLCGQVRRWLRTAPTSRPMGSVTSSCQSTTVPVAANGLQCLMARPVSMLTSFSAVTRMGNSSDVTALHTLKPARQQA